MQNYDFGERIYELRKAKGLSQKELGALIDVSNKAVSKWETGAAVPKTETIIKLASVLDVTVEELLSGKQNEIEKLDTLDALSNKTANMSLQNKIKSFETQKANEEYKKAKAYLICIVCLFVTITILFSLLSLSNNVFNPYIQINSESDLSISECILQSMGMAYILCGVYTGIVLFARLVKKIPGWVIALLCIFFPLTFVYIEISGLVMVLPEVVISIKALINKGKSYINSIDSNSFLPFENTSLSEACENIDSSKPTLTVNRKKSNISIAFILISIAIATICINQIPGIGIGTAYQVISRDYPVSEIFEIVTLNDKYSLCIFSTVDNELGVAYLKNHKDNEYSYNIAYTATPEIYFQEDNGYYINASGKTEKVYFDITNDKTTIPQDSQITEFTYNNETCYFYIINTELKNNFGNSCGVNFK